MVPSMIWFSAALACFMAPFVAANWDPATGHLRNYQVTAEWLAKNKPVILTKEIQVSECAKNTRLHFPEVQLFAMFRVNHLEDHYHGCPYGDCLAFNVAPGPQDVVANFTDSHLFFWHEYGGIAGDGVKPISDPQTGAYGYEESLTGKFKSGPLNTASLQLHHDSNYPKFNQSQLNRWTPEERNQFQADQNPQPIHPKCGRPCDPNKDPGSAPGAYGNYKPSAATQYTPPTSWLPRSEDICFAHGGYSQPDPQPDPHEGQKGNGTHLDPQPDPHGGGKGNGTYHRPPNHCKAFCKCLKKCNGDDCSSCDSKNKASCSKDDCKTSPSRSKRCN